MGASGELEGGRREKDVSGFEAKFAHAIIFSIEL